MSAHHTISAATIELVAQRAGVRTQDVRRTVVGLPVADAARIRAELKAAGVDTSWLERLSTASAPISDWVDRRPLDKR